MSSPVRVPELERQTQMSTTKKLYVGRLPRGCTPSELEDAFKKFGEVRFVDVKGDFGFVVW